MMHFWAPCISLYIISLLPSLIATLAVQSQVNLTQALIEAGLPRLGKADIGGALHAPNSPGSSWCRPQTSEVDLLYSTFGGRPLDYLNVMFAVGVLRKVANEKVKENGKDASIKRRTLRINVRNIVITVFDERLADRTWQEVHDVVDVLLLCVYIKKIAAETAGTFFHIESQKRWASVMMAVGAPEEEAEEIAES
ncbi:MAG: hypothetical protein LQ341_004114 [Variospora aurantia]|nr:MAG: hypothetical protein LQ341_004114 [Variospora aurantia]